MKKKTEPSRNGKKTTNQNWSGGGGVKYEA